MKINYTGRILDWFVKDLKALTARGVQFHVLPVQEKPYRPPGLWCVTPADGWPLLWVFPQPLHPIEAIASLRGFGGPRVDLERVKKVALARAASWVDYTRHLSEYLFVTPETVRLVWHLLTPLNAPPGYADRVYAAQTVLWDRVTGDVTLAPLLGGHGGPERVNFWTEEVTGEIEL